MLKDKIKNIVLFFKKEKLKKQSKKLNIFDLFILENNQNIKSFLDINNENFINLLQNNNKSLHFSSEALIDYEHGFFEGGRKTISESQIFILACLRINLLKKDNKDVFYNFAVFYTDHDEMGIKEIEKASKKVEYYANDVVNYLLNKNYFSSSDFLMIKNKVNEKRMDILDRIYLEQIKIEKKQIIESIEKIEKTKQLKIL